MERKGLGRGLSALLADVATVEEAPRPGPAPAGTSAGSVGTGQNLVPIDRIRANPDQPRRAFDEKEMQDLAASIREKGVIQPLILMFSKHSANLYRLSVSAFDLAVKRKLCV